MDDPASPGNCRSGSHSPRSGAPVETMRVSSASAASRRPSTLVASRYALALKQLPTRCQRRTPRRPIATRARLIAQSCTDLFSEAMIAAFKPGSAGGLRVMATPERTGTSHWPSTTSHVQPSGSERPRAVGIKLAGAVKRFELRQ